MSYVAVSDVQFALNITNADEMTVGQLQEAAAAATEAIERHCDRVFTLDDTATQRVFDWYSSAELAVDDIGDAGTISVTVGGQPYTTFTTRPLNAIARGKPITALWATAGAYWLPSPYWPPQAQFAVTARWGWPSVPAPVSRAALILAVKYYNRKDAPQGVMGFADVIGGAIRVPGSDPDVAALLAPYRRLVVA